MSLKYNQYIKRFTQGLIVGVLIGLAFTPTTYLVPLPAQNQLHVKAIHADRQKMELEFLCPMVHEVVLRAEVQDRDTFVRIQEGEYYRARLEPGEVGTTRRNRLIVEFENGYAETLRLLGVSLR